MTMNSEHVAACTYLLWILQLLSNVFLSSAQTGFISIDSGATDPSRNPTTGIEWTTDAGFIATGANYVIPDISQQGDQYPEKATFRYFPVDSTPKKNCYELPASKGVQYLIRAGFFYSSHIDKVTIGLALTFHLSIDQAVIELNLTGYIGQVVQKEAITTAVQRQIWVCLVQTSATDAPFISSLEMRPLVDTMYDTFSAGERMLTLVNRWNFGVDSSSTPIRYPVDSFDRIWRAPYEMNNKPRHQNSSSPVRNIETNSQFASSPNQVPSQVLQTAWQTTESGSLWFLVPLPKGKSKHYRIVLYFAKFTKNTAASPIFHLLANSRVIDRGIAVNMSDTAAFHIIEFSNAYVPASGPITVKLIPEHNTTAAISVSAFELFIVNDPTPSRTHAGDVETIRSLMQNFGLEYFGDPCSPPDSWEWISCKIQAQQFSRITHVLLSNRKLSGTIPDMSKINQLTELWLDHNKLTGPIPALQNLTSLKVLNLEENQLSGPLPEITGLTKLHMLLLANNNFSGTAVQYSIPGLNYSYDGNPYILPLSEPLAAEAAFSPQVPSPTADHNWTPKHFIRYAAVILSTVACTSAGFLACYVWCKRRNSKSISLKDGPEKSIRHGGSDVLEADWMRSSLELLARAFSLEQVTLATSVFEKRIGKGGYGFVYYGILPDGQEIAVKVRASNSKQGGREFFNEVELLSRVHHKNLLNLVGYCNEMSKLILIYEFMPCGTLREHLYGPNFANARLSWNTRLQIALDSAQGLWYLHEVCKPCIIHRDVKTSNILLDSNLVAKVADFGISKSTSETDPALDSGVIRGTAGYIDPEYCFTRIGTKRSDVYSFGVVLLELICGREPINNKLPDRDEWNLVQWVRTLSKDGNLSSFVDKTLVTYNKVAMWKLVELAVSSADPVADNRPTMEEIIQIIKDIIEFQEPPDVNSSPAENFWIPSTISTDSCSHSSVVTPSLCVPASQSARSS